MHNLSKIYRFLEISFTSIYRRIRKIIPEINNDNNNVLAAIDSSGFKITLRGIIWKINGMEKEGDGLN